MENIIARNYKRDYDELPQFVKQYVGKTVSTVIEDYAKKRKVVEHRIGKVFWNLVDDGSIKVEAKKEYSQTYDVYRDIYYIV